MPCHAEHNRDCTPLCVEVPLFRPHAVYSPRSKIDREEVAKCAIHKEEYVGVLGKEYTAKEQEKRLKIGLTRLIDDAAYVTNPRSLLEQSSCRLMCDNALYIHGFFSANCGYAWVRKGRGVVGTLEI